MIVKKSSKVKIIIWVIILVIILMIVIDFVRGFSEPNVIMDGDKLVIRSSYGVTIAKREIYAVRLINEIPTLTRGSGFGVGNTQKGRVKVSNLGEGFAYIRAENPPYIYLDLISYNGNYMFLNLHDANDTLELYESIQEWLGK